MHNALLRFMRRAPAAYVAGRADVMVARFRLFDDARHVAVPAYAWHVRAEYPPRSVVRRGRPWRVVLPRRDVASGPVDELPPLFAQVQLHILGRNVRRVRLSAWRCT